MTVQSVRVSPTQSQVMAALRVNFLLKVLPSNVEVVLGQDNRVPEPKVLDFVVMTSNRRNRLTTNVDSSADAYFIGSVAGNVLTVASVVYGKVIPGNLLFGVNVSDGTQIQSQTSGPAGGAGTYLLNNPQTISSQPFAAGSKSCMQETQVTVQLDVHGPNGEDNSQIISTLFRDEYGVSLLAESGIAISPLYADTPQQIPFVNGEQQYEDRWVIHAELQVDEIVIVPQQFADALNVVLINVDATYPP